jgi:hypothetical protein
MEAGVADEDDGIDMIDRADEVPERLEGVCE